MTLKPIQDVVAVVIDYGTFLSLAEKLSETMKTVYYYSPFEEEYQDIRQCVTGMGLSKVKRLDDFLEPDVLKTIDLFIFPDIGYGGLQRHLRSIGKAVWGSMGASEFELSRTMFIDILKKVGLPMVPSRKIIGLTALADHLKVVKDKWIKINRFRRNMETWHHIDWTHSQRMVDSLVVVFGGYKEQIEFVVQDNIKSDVELGYDGWCVDGEFPDKCFQSYEKKNELNLASLFDYKNIPKEIQYVNEKMSPILRDYGYRCGWGMEIRVKDNIPYFIDPTARTPGLAGEQQFENCENLAEVILHGANGELIMPKFTWKFAAEATLHYEASSSDTAISQEWKTLKFSKEDLKWLKLYHFCKIDGVHHFIPSKVDEVGVVIGFGNSVKESIDSLEKNLEDLKGLPVHANTEGFGDLLASITEAEKQGIPFSNNGERSQEPNHKSKEKVGKDFDGVVSEGSPVKKGDVIITGRTPDLHQKTVKEMDKMGMPKVPIHHYQKDDLGDDKKDRDKKIGLFKAKKINELGITKFHEDTPLQASIIRKKTDAKVILKKK